MSKSNELDKAVKQYILDTLEDGDTNKDKCKALKERFEAEYGWRVSQVGEMKACTDWLQGLALNIAYMNYEILELAKTWGSLPDNATEKQEDKILDNYWQFMANKCLQLMRGYRVPK